MAKPTVAGIDVFCGAGGLTYGLRKAGIRMVAGIDLDPACGFPFTGNNAAAFIKADVRDLRAKDLAKLYPAGTIRLLAGCAPCRPFSPFRRGEETWGHEEWGLVGEFRRLVEELKPELVTMENVPDLGHRRMFRGLLRSLKAGGYHVDSRSVYCPPLGIPQHRRRLVLLASRIGPVTVPSGALTPEEYKTVRDTIGTLSPLAAGEVDPKDRLHRARSVTETNLRRLQSSRPGGTWRDWPKQLRARCHRRKSGSSYQAVYARMAWDEPSPTITTQAYNFGTGRFGHPEQDRSITLREAALLQTFPRRYRFVDPRDKVFFTTVGKLIGNAVPPRLALSIGRELMRAAAEHRRGRED